VADPEDDGVMMKPDEYRQAVAKTMFESQLQAKVRRHAHQYGFTLIYHTHRSERSDPGFPDLVMVKGARLLFVELKAQAKYPTPTQREWLIALSNTAAEVYVWRPSDLLDGTIDRILRGELE
jgi:hypothetical protein